MEEQSVTIPLNQYTDWLIMITKLDSIKKVLIDDPYNYSSFGELAAVVKSCQKLLDIEKDNYD